MRLIDADELNELMTSEWFLDSLAANDSPREIKNKIENAIDSVPLAFDVDKVSDGIRDYFKDKIEKGKDIDGWSIVDFNSDIQGIVRKGGVE